MKQLIYIAVISLISGQIYAGDKLGELNSNLKHSEISFTENKGQIHDQYNKSRPDVLYGVLTGNMSVHIKKSGVSYQLYGVDSWNEGEDLKTNKKRKEIESQTIYRVDLNWSNANKNIWMSQDETLPGFTNYYLESCPNGALNVTSYSGVTLHNIYNGINVHYYEKNGELKHDYIVAPHSDYKQIQLKVEGALIKINSDGTLLLTTPLGKIQEGAPIVYQSGKQLKAKWLLNKNNLSLEIENYNSSLELIIDPVTRLWGTYYGGADNETGYSCSTDASGNVYLSGTTGALSTGTSIATLGSHQTTYVGGTYKAFLTKFDSDGVRLWGTYFGGNGNEQGVSCSTDPSGNVYLTGQTTTNSSSVIATPGCHQSSYLGGGDAFLVKFNSSGVRQWSTYFGGTGTENVYCCKADLSGNVYITGGTASNGVDIPSITAHQTTYGGGTFDAFLVKFNSAGVRQWSTYYGGNNTDNGKSCSVDASQNVYLVGATSSTAMIATAGSHKTTKSTGPEDAFIVKFNSVGVRQWGTYYGGNGQDIINSCAIDGLGDLYIAGQTASSGSTVVATSSSHQSIHGGSIDAFLAKFNTIGVRQWGTYYGGTGDDYGYSCSTDTSNNVYLSGSTTTTLSPVIATIGAFQGNHSGGGNDAFLAKFNTSGVRQYGTFYGGSVAEFGQGIDSDNSGNIYLCGRSNSGDGIATTSSHQPTLGGAYDAFIVKIGDCTPINPINNTPISNQSICSGSNTILYANSGLNSINWYSTATSTTILSTGTTFTTPILSTGTYTYYAEASGCVLSNSRTAISVRVAALPVISVNSGSICTGSSFTMSPSGASTYTFSGGSAIVSPITSSSYTVTGTSSDGCISSVGAISNVNVNSLPNVSATTDNTLICTGQTATLSASGASTYTWSNSQNVPSIAVSPTTTTTYTLSGTDINGCVNSAVITQSVSACTGLQNITIDFEINIYPNPNNGLFIINSTEKCDVEIIDILGSVISKQLNISGTQTMDITNYANGIYFVKIKINHEQAIIKRIVKQ